jgi:hypothetical protein
MRVLVACEYSGTVRDAFIAQGHDAMSCDILATERPGPHHEGDVREVLADDWDLVIAHPPCTYLCNSGVRWLYTEDGRWEKLDEAAEFFRLFLDADCPRVCIENPVMSSHAIKRIGGVKQSQSVQPYEFGHPESKRTCFWLRGLPALRPTDILERPACGHWANQSSKTGGNGGKMPIEPRTPDRWKLRSATYQGIADAMADQWGAPQPVQGELFP